MRARATRSSAPVSHRRLASSLRRRHRRHILISHRHDPLRLTAPSCGPSDHARYTKFPTVPSREIDTMRRTPQRVPTCGLTSHGRVSGTHRPPQPPILEGLRENVDTFTGGAGLVACACPRPWTWNGPDTINPAKETTLRKQRRERCARRPAAASSSTAFRPHHPDTIRSHK